MAFRVDYGTFGSVERTPQGGLKIPAFLTRTGVFEYQTEDGRTIKEWRPPDEVFNKDSMAMLRGSPIALDHPPEPISTDNFRTFAVGHVADDVTNEKDKVAATLYVQDAQAVKAVENGRRELSCGYHCDVDETPGIAPDGTAYDRVQRNIKYNHLALVDNGRAGHSVRMRLDSAGNQSRIITGAYRMDTTKMEIIGGVEYTVGTDAHRAARERLDSARKTERKSMEKLNALYQQAVARADAADEKLASVVAATKKLLSPERLDQAARKRAALIGKAQTILGAQFKTDSLSNREIKLAAVKKAFPTMKLDGKDPAYISGLFRAIELKKAPQVRQDSALRQALSPVPKDGGSPAAPGRTYSQVRQDAMLESDMRSKRPLSMSRRDRFKQMSSHPMLQGAQLEVMK